MSLEVLNNMKKITKRNNTKFDFFTKGNEFAFEDGTEYVGIYWSRDGKSFSGKDGSDKTSKRIFPYAVNEGLPNRDELNVEAFIYEKLNTKVQISRKTQTPRTIYPSPSKKDYDKTFFSRFFIKRDNTGEITEVDEKQYKKIKNEAFYSGHEIDWKLSGPLNDITDRMTGAIIAHGVQSTNQRTLITAEKEFSGIIDFVTDAIKFAKITPY